MNGLAGPRIERISLAGIRLASWDVDGTLYRPSALRWAMGWRLLSSCLSGGGRRTYRGLRAFQAARSRLERLRGRPATVPEAGSDHPADEGPRADFERDLLEPALAAIGPRPGVADVLALLNRRGLVQVVFSDYRAEGKLRALGLTAHFAASYAGERLAAPKPSPVALWQIARDFAVRPEEVIHIGDRVDTDGAAAAAFGARGVILGRDFVDFPALARQLREGPGLPSASGRAAGT